MGWDAYAFDAADGRCDREIRADVDYLWLNDDVVRRGFGEAVWALKQADQDCLVDALLIAGGLDHFECGRVLQEATGRPVVGEWSAPDVEGLASSAVWERSTQRPWATACARAFLETCAALGLGVVFC